MQAATIGGHVTPGIIDYAQFANQIKADDYLLWPFLRTGASHRVEIPAPKEQGIDVELANWRGVFGGRN